MGLLQFCNASLSACPETKGTKSGPGRCGAKEPFAQQPDRDRARERARWRGKTDYILLVSFHDMPDMLGRKWRESRGAGCCSAKMSDRASRGSRVREEEVEAKRRCRCRSRCRRVVSQPRKEALCGVQDSKVDGTTVGLLGRCGQPASQ
jgi:hypothetical protein